MTGQPGVIAPLTATLTSPRHSHQPLPGSTGPEVHPSRKLNWSQAPGSPEEGQRVDPQANFIHTRLG